MSETTSHPEAPATERVAIPDAVTSISAVAFASARPLTKSLTAEAAEITREFGWDFFKAGVLIADEWPTPPADFNEDPEATYLLVKEAKIKEKQPDGTKKWVKSDKGKWNLPCGRLKIGESFEEAALREGEEETGRRLQLDKLVHIGHRRDGDNPYVIFIYAATELEFIAPPDPEEIAETRWFTYDEIIALGETAQLRNPDLTIGALNHYRKYELQPDGLLVTYPFK